MSSAITLAAHLQAALREGPDLALQEVILAIAGACAEIADLIALGPIAGGLNRAAGANADGDVQKELDLLTHAIVMAALRAAPVASVLSEEGEHIESLNPAAPLAVAIDPLDGSSNIDTNMSIGTIFSILPSAPPKGAPEALGAFGGPGARQLAAGFVVYGPQTALVLTTGAGVDVFTLDRRDQTFRLTRPGVTIVEGTKEYAINASNYRHWELPVRTYIDDCLSGSTGLRGQDFNMRWIGSLVAEAFRILARGGIFLYPADKRPGYRQGRLRLIYEAHPMAFVIEQAAGLASNGRERILDLCASSLHQRTPLIFGAKSKVERVQRMHLSPQTGAEHSPLFARRGLFRT
jgi:fructose-1,6-bisphosphatase I